MALGWLALDRDHSWCTIPPAVELDAHFDEVLALFRELSAHACATSDATNGSKQITFDDARSVNQLAPDETRWKNEMDDVLVRSNGHPVTITRDVTTTRRRRRPSCAALPHTS
jgi:hypothetical protein